MHDMNTLELYMLNANYTPVQMLDALDALTDAGVISDNVISSGHIAVYPMI